MARKRKSTNFNPQSVGDYEVGYGKPPQDSKFQEGECRNPGGRPKGSKNKPKPLTEFAKMVQAEGQRRVPVVEGAKKKMMPLNLAMIRKRGVKALQGDGRLMRDHLNLMMAADRDLRAERENNFQSMVDYKLRAAAELRECFENGVPPPRFYPHPDHILPDFENRTCTIAGPLNARQEKGMHQVFLVIQWLKLDIVEDQRLLEEEPDYEHKDKVLMHIAENQAGIRRLETAKGLRWPTKPPDEFPDIELLKAMTPEKVRR